MQPTGGASQACPLSGHCQPLPHCSPQDYVVWQDCTLLFANWVTTAQLTNPHFHLHYLWNSNLNFSFHQAALLLWWQRLLPFMPIGPILPNHKQVQHCIWTLSMCMQPPPCALSLLKWAGKWNQYLKKEKEHISGATIPVCSQVWHLCTDSPRPTCLPWGLQELCQWHWHCSCL